MILDEHIRKDATHNKKGQLLVDLRAKHSNFPEQDPLTIKVAEIHEKVSSMKSWTAPGSDMIHTYWLKLTKLNELHKQT